MQGSPRCAFLKPGITCGLDHRLSNKWAGLSLQFDFNFLIIVMLNIGSHNYSYMYHKLRMSSFSSLPCLHYKEKKKAGHEKEILLPFLLV